MNRINNFYRFYLNCFLIILTLPIITIPPLFFPADWAKIIPMRSIIAVIFVVFFYQFLFKKNQLNLPKIKDNKIIWAILGIFITFSLATLFSVDINFSLWGSPYRGQGFVTFAFYLIFAFLSFLLVKKEDWPKLWNFSILIGILVSLVAIIQFHGLLGRIFLAVPERPPSTLGGPIFLGIYLMMLFCATLTFLLKESSNKKRIFYILALLLFLYVILISGSRAAYLGLIVAMIYFLLAFPANNKKVIILKIACIAVILLGIGFIYYVNSTPVENLPKFFQTNILAKAIVPRLSIELFLIDPRFSAWQVAWQAIKEKPILGWGPENFAVAFDKNYNPSLPYISKDWGGWWDKGHNIFFDLAVQAGVLGFVAYLVLIIVIFWQLYKFKEDRILSHGLRALFISYIVANLFSFDTFGTYLLLFFTIGFVTSLTYKNELTQNPINTKKKITNERKIFFTIIAICAIWFLWQFNLKPFSINANINSYINTSTNQASEISCKNNLEPANDLINNHSFLDVYTRIKYVEFLKDCAKIYPENNLKYAERGIELLTEASKMQPTYSRTWIFLGSFTVVKAANIQEPEIKQKLIDQAQSYFNNAQQLAPNHQEITIERAKMYMVIKDYENMKNESEKCINLESTLGDCYWYLTLSQIYLKDFVNAQKNLDKAKYWRVDLTLPSNLNQITLAYMATKNYDQISLLYLKLLDSNPKNFQYRATLAYLYKEMERYKEAIDQARIIIEQNGENSDIGKEAELFIKTIYK